MQFNFLFVTEKVSPKPGFDNMKYRQLAPEACPSNWSNSVNLAAEKQN